MQESIPQKQCSTCGDFKPATKEFFVVGKGHRDGLRSLCKECKNKARRKTAPDILPEGHKRCSRCRRVLAATEEHFPLHRRSKDHLDTYCRKCRHEIYQEKKTRPQQEVPAPTWVCNVCGEEKAFTDAFFHKDPSLRYGLRKICKSCAYKRQEDDRKQNPEKYRAMSRRYQRKNRKKITTYQSQWREANRERIHANERRRRQEKPELFRATKHRYLQTEKGKIQSRLSCQKRKTQKKGIGGSHTAQDIERQYRAQKGKCYWCGKKVGMTYDVDHLIPITREGSSNDPWNLVIACRSCNTSRRNRLPHEWPAGGRLL